MAVNKTLTREMLDLLAGLAGPEFYGRLDITCKNGEITLVRKGQTIKPTKQLTGSNYSGTISIIYEAGQIVHAEKIERIDIK
jgi:hypothetical protein